MGSVSANSASCSRVSSADIDFIGLTTIDPAGQFVETPTVPAEVFFECR
jgi:hypothetical protein